MLSLLDENPSLASSRSSSPSLKCTRTTKRKAIPNRSLKVADDYDKLIHGVFNLDVYSVYVQNPSQLLARRDQKFCMDSYKNTANAPTVCWKKGGIMPISPDSIRFEQLTPEEVGICSTLRILPDQYLHIKETILSQVAKRGPFKKRDAKSWFRIDVNKVSSFYPDCNYF
jgi:hypothetical protein